jgi:predicted PurR-regulated permease PerM
MGFPKLLAIGAMVFVLGLIPVAGVIISLIPLSIIAFNIGGIIKVLYVLIMVLMLHGLESYLLNPKFMSVKTKLPVFLIFLILIISEYLMGVWGLLIGIPLFMFILDMMGLDLTEEKTLKEPNKNL